MTDTSVAHKSNYEGTTFVLSNVYKDAALTAWICCCDPETH